MERTIRYIIYIKISKKDLDLEDYTTGNSYGWGAGLIGCSNSNIEIRNLNMSKVNIKSNTDTDGSWDFFK